MIILVMGLPGSGKTTFARRLYDALDNPQWFNADDVRLLYNDWDFTIEGRLRQARRMRSFAESAVSKYVIIDMVCPLQEMRDIMNPDIIVWMDTIKAGRYEDTNSLFVCPDKYTYRITSFGKEEWSNIILKISLLH